jgi:hypothetical protein
MPESREWGNGSQSNMVYWTPFNECLYIPKNESMEEDLSKGKIRLRGDAS